MKVLLVEDNKGDQLILREALQEVNANIDLDIVEDGVQAIDYLTSQGPYKEAIRPDLMLLDLNLPKKNGREVLAEIRNNPKLQHLLVLILSNSTADSDVCECYRIGANLYMKKPSGYEEMVNFANIIKSWKQLIQSCSHG